ncbi:MAG TPA: hypothetical protein VKW76_14085 [Candidatus Binatia bacterium]|nr:hypothetical protein [Candidatus Binatia bacterium]
MALTLRGARLMAAVAATLLAGAGPALAGRCGTPLISGGLKASCPSPDDPGLPGCPPGTTRVVYRLDKPFPPDGSVSSVLVNPAAGSPCAGAPKTVGLLSDSYIIGCWLPKDPRGCRTVHIFNNGTMCLHFAPDPLGCGGPACSNLSIEQVAISNAGAADRHLCRPVDPATSCRSARLNGAEMFRLWIGGLCSTMDLDGQGDTNGACISQWGATYWGYGAVKQRGVPLDPGWYDWQTGTFKVATAAGRPQCGALGQCLGQDGRNSPWIVTLVGVPDDRIPNNNPPCLDDSSGLCQAPGCFQ